LPRFESPSTGEKLQPRGEYRPSRSRGSSWYVVDRLRQDILVALINDLERASEKGVPKKVGDDLHKAMWRFVEVFEFRGELLGSGPYSAAYRLATAVDEWLSVSRGARSEPNDLREPLHKARDARSAFTTSLRRERVRDDSALFLDRLDELISDVFSELAASGCFPQLSRSLERFRQRLL
jgi:hypothetical protein